MITRTTRNTEFDAEENGRADRRRNTLAAADVKSVYGVAGDSLNGITDAALLDVRIETQELMMPPSLQLDQVGGFALHMARAVLRGRGTEPVDLARANLRQPAARSASVCRCLSN